VSVTGDFNNNTGQLLSSTSGTNGTVSITGTLTNSIGGTITFDGSSDALSANGVINSGDINLDGSNDTLTDTASFVNNNYMWEAANAAATVAGDFSNNSGAEVRLGTDSSLSVTGTLTNAGQINMTGAGASLTADLTNSGPITLGANNDTLTDLGDFTNNSPGSLSLTHDTDKVTVAGTFNNNAGATVTMSGTNGLLSAVSAFINGGTVSLTGSGDTLSAMAFSNSGTVSIGANETVKTTGGHPGYTYTQTGGSTTVNGTLTAVASGVSLQGGSLLGVGTINGNLDNSGGSVEPASAPGVPGKLTLNGNYTQESGGTLTIDINGAGPGHFSVLDVLGSASWAETSTLISSGSRQPPERRSNSSWPETLPP